MMKEKFLEYVRIQESGVTNMFDVNYVCELSDGILERDDVLDIFENYETYRQQWCSVEQE